jgi:hypothetical protein
VTNGAGDVLRYLSLQSPAALQLSSMPRQARLDAVGILAVRDLKLSVTHLARVLGMTPSAISYAVTRGKGIADEKGIQLGELLNN